MSYIGSSAAPLPVNFRGVQTQALSPNGSTSLFTLNRAVTSVTDIEVVVNNVQQSPFDGSYSIVNSGLGLQFSENPTAGTNSIYITYRDQPMGSIVDPTAVRKTGDTMTGTLTVGGNVLLGSLPGGVRTIGASSGSDTTVVIQAGAAVGGGPNLELTRDQIAYLDSNQTIFRSTDGSTQYGKFDASGRFTLLQQPSFFVYRNAGDVTAGNVILYNGVNHNTGNCYSTATGRFTAPVTGTYLFLAQSRTQGAVSRYVVLRKNGTGISTVVHENAGGTGYYSTHNNTLIMQLTAGDYVDVQVSASGGGVVYASDTTQTTFSGQLIS